MQRKSGGLSVSSSPEQLWLQRQAQFASACRSAARVTGSALPTNFKVTSSNPRASADRSPGLPLEQRLRDQLLRALDGDDASYRSFLRDLASYLRGFLRKRLSGLPDEVEDLVQETLLAIHNQRHSYDARQPLTAWLHAIAKYKLIDCLRRRSLREELNDPLDNEFEVLAQSDTEAADARRDLARLLETLPSRQRDPIVHMKLEGLSVAETARLTGMSESAVKIGVFRGMKALALLVGAGRGEIGSSGDEK